MEFSELKFTVSYTLSMLSHGKLIMTSNLKWNYIHFMHPIELVVEPYLAHLY